MPDLTQSLKRVPKWAWYTSGGVALAGVGIYVMQNRAGVEPPADTTDPTDAGVTGYPDSSSPSPVPGIVVPDVNVQGGDGGSSLDLQTLYISAMGDLLQSMRDGGGGNPSPADPQMPVINIVTGGGVPSGNRPGVVTAQPPTSQQKPKQPPARYHGHVLSWWQNPAQNRRNIGTSRKPKYRWYWPGDARNRPPTHTRKFAGHTKPDKGTGPHEG